MLRNPADSRQQRTRRGDSGHTPHLPPPWADRHFLTRCTRCMECLPVCPQGVLVRGADGYPSIDYSLGSCTFCNECVSICRARALERTHPDNPAWHRTAGIVTTCLELQRHFCRSCAEQCTVDAIRFMPLSGGRSLPMVQSVLCTGCGACVRHCPVDAIKVHDLQSHTRDTTRYEAVA